MQSIQSNLVAIQASQEQSSIPLRPVASATANEISSEKAYSDRQPIVTEDLFAAFTWLFGSGCY